MLCDKDSEVGSIFHKCSITPNQQNWVENTLLGDPKEVMCSSKYEQQETMLEFLNKLAKEGGSKHFKVQDKAIRAGGAWLCEVAIRSTPKAAIILGRHCNESKDAMESDLQRRKREAKERAMMLMQEKMTKFAEGLKDANNCVLMESNEKNRHIFDKKDKSQDFLEPSSYHHQQEGNNLTKESQLSLSDDDQPPLSRLIDRPQCIICGDNAMLNETSTQSDKRNSKVLAFCGLVQPSVVLKGGGSTPYIDDGVSTHVGIHMSLCGHAVHTSCCESHLSGTALRENIFVDRNKKEFRCPLCRRLSNCLVPCIDIGSEWIKKPEEKRKRKLKETKLGSGDEKKPLLHDFLSQSKWWATRNDESVIWNGRCSFVPSKTSLNNRESVTLKKKSKPKTYGKKDLYKAWGSVLSTPSFIRRVDSTLSDDSDSQTDNSTISPNTDVWKKVLDRIVDVSYKADLKRLGEECLSLNYGEFRHYLLEKSVFNHQNSLAGIEPSSVSNQ